MSSPPDEMVLLSCGTDTLLYEVQGAVQNQLAQGPLMLVPGADGAVTARVGDVSWALSKDVPCLRSDNHTYTFALPGQPGAPLSFYCVILQQDLPASEIEQLQSLLTSATAYSGDNPAEGSDSGFHEEGTGVGAQVSEAARRSAVAITGGLSWLSARTSAGLSILSEKSAAGMAEVRARVQAAQAPPAAPATEGGLPPSYAESEEHADGPLLQRSTTSARVEQAKEVAKAGLASAGSFASRVASDVRSASSRLVDVVGEKSAEAKRSESVRKFRESSSEVGAEVWENMQRASEAIAIRMRSGATLAAASLRKVSQPIAEAAPAQ
ncbi:hypothetical protein FOA52_002772 [Chlamydomonas sp. UWO 241]|nr:hypothetical protein FOA52_002772 [Chlamydomonas sp. UWO 241]